VFQNESVERREKHSQFPFNLEQGQRPTSERRQTKTVRARTKTQESKQKDEEEYEKNIHSISKKIKDLSAEIEQKKVIFDRI